MNEIRLTNPYIITDLEYEGHKGIPEDDHGYIQFVYPATPEVQAVIDRFDQPQTINLREYVAHLRKVLDQIRNLKIERRGHNGKFSP
jgi:hypothetical protein